MARRVNPHCRLAAVCLLLVAGLGLCGCDRRPASEAFFNEPLPADRTYTDAAESPDFRVRGSVTLRDVAGEGRRQVLFDVTVENRTEQPIRGLRVKADLPEAVRAYRDPGYARFRAFGQPEPIDLVPGQIPLGLRMACQEALPDPMTATAAERERLYEALRQPIRLGLWWEGGEAYLELQPEDILYTGFPQWVAASALPRSMKGYELYSWREGDGWRFALLTGTNRSKSCQEVTAGEERVDEGWVQLSAAGVPALEGLLARLPRGESVFWVPAGWPGLEGQCLLALPDGAAVDEIRAHCERLGIELSLPGAP